MSIFDRWLPTPQDKFAKRYLDELIAQGDFRPWRYEKAHFTLTCARDNAFGGHIALAEPYQYFCSLAPSESDLHLRKIVYAARALAPAGLDAVLPNLFPAIRHVAERKNIDLMGSPGEAGNHIYIPLCGELEIALVHYTPFGTTRLTSDHLARLGKTQVELGVAALANLRRYSSKPMITIRPGFYLSHWLDAFTPSRLLLHELIARYPVKGMPVVMAPTPKHLVLTGSEDIEGQALMACVAQETMRPGRALSSQAMCLVNGCWQNFILDDVETHLALCVQDLDSHYARQKTLLDAAHARNGVDIEVADYLVDSDVLPGQMIAMCTWREGEHTLLPDTDWIALERGARDERIVVRTQDISVICGHLLQKTDHTPIRYEVKEFPQHSHYDQLAERALLHYKFFRDVPAN